MTENPITVVPPTPKSPWAIELSDEDRDDLIDAVMSASADESHFEEASAVARLDRRVTVERDGTFVCEEFSSVEDAEARYAFVEKLVRSTNN
jgi:hypothetical protein